MARLLRRWVAEYGRGYTARNLWRMIQFAEAFRGEDRRQAVATIELVSLSRVVATDPASTTRILRRNVPH